MALVKISDTLEHAAIVSESIANKLHLAANGDMMAFFDASALIGALSRLTADLLRDFTQFAEEREKTNTKGNTIETV